MRNHKGCKRAYTRSSKTYYSEVLQNKTTKVMIGMYHPDGGTSGEFEVEWVVLGRFLSARLKCFEDSWSSLAQFKDLLEIMEKIDSLDIQEPDFCKILDSLDILDITEYEQAVPANIL